MDQDPDYDYMKKAGLVVVVERILGRLTKDKPPAEEVYQHVGATALSVKIEEQVKQAKGAWPDLVVSSEENELLGTLQFNLWDYSNDQLMVFMEDIFRGVCVELDVPNDKLRTFLQVVRHNYNPDVKFHNFKHAFAVLQHCYALLVLCNIRDRFPPLERLALLVSCVCHDLLHPGLNNSYQKNAQTPLALLYNDQSVLENFHCACTFAILNTPECNLLAHVPEQQRAFREAVVACILATDVSKHHDHYTALLGIIREGAAGGGDGFTWDEPKHRRIAMQNFMMMGDLNNETRAFANSQVWGPLVQEEFCLQGDKEAAQGLPVLPMMQRTAKVEKEQQGFIKYLCLPLYEANAELWPELRVCVENLKSNVESWSKV
eukprot:TRINITY_DN33044_c0_g1_i1.p1 TRINITY_DN33044_c0_g1~~TRINITY_DN33044_c0_g1_i1.p1  ORF type:complete len:375 (+),score=141.80 TRINITY_DN33044_c0_g1_i1:55-1179(+)